MLHSLPEHKITEGIVNHISDTKGAARGAERAQAPSSP